MTWASQEDRERRLRRARLAGWASLVACAGVVVVTVVLLIDGAAGPVLLLADLLTAFAAVRTVLRLRSIGRALREDA